MPRRALVRLVLAVGLGGLLVAALALPLVLGPDLVAGRLTAAGGPTSAEEAAAERPPVGATRVLATDGSLITEFYDRDRTPVTGDQIAPVVKQALVDIEDDRFYRHGAVDPVGTLRALITDVRSRGAAQGGSTLTQQLVEQTLVQATTTTSGQQAATADTLGRKLTEARLAAHLESTLSKDEILTAT